MSPDHLDILRQAVEENLAKVRENATAENLKNWKAAVRDLEEAEAEFTGDGGPERIKGIPGVIRYLDGKGWKISSSTAYNHRETNRMPGPDKDGCFHGSQLDIYAREYLKRKDGSSDADEDGQGSQGEKQKASAEKERQQAENWRIRNEILKGTYVERSFMEREFGSRSAFLRTDLNTFWEIHALTIIELTGGDPAKVPALVEKGQDWVRDWTDRYARPIKYPEPKAPAGEPGE